MKKRFLRLKTAMRAVMLILIMGVVGVTEGFAQIFSVDSPDFVTQKCWFFIALIDK